jgi:pSer/pThr/pTyr-binding forkhead associated (FHA) protein
MQPSKLVLLVTQGERAGEEFDFDQRCRYLIGRADDCDIQLGRFGAAFDVSRHHCELEFDPPNIWLRDLGSRNGTFLNDHPIGRRGLGNAVEDVDLQQFPSFGVISGDTIRVGNTVFRVGLIGDEAEGPDTKAALSTFF